MVVSVKISDIEYLTERQVYSITIPHLSIPLKFFPVFYGLITGKDMSFTFSRNHSKLCPRVWPMKQCLTLSKIMLMTKCFLKNYVYPFFKILHELV